MADDKDKSPLISVSAAVVILAALGVTMFVQPFKSSRPFVTEYRESYETVNARLWQDPFQAVVDSAKEAQPEAAGQLKIMRGDQDLKKEIPFRFRSKYLQQINGKDNITVLAVMVPGGPYFEGTESRMRYRYALLSGLKRVGFVGEDPEHIEFIKIGVLGDKITLSNIIPIEWLAPENDKKQKVLVLWINDDVFNGTPLAKLARVIDYVKSAEKWPTTNVEIKIIGPAISGRLREMIQEARRDKSATDASSLLKSQIYSPLATVDNTRLFANDDGSETSEQNISDKTIAGFRRHKIELIRTIGTDNELVQSLIDELKLRGVDLRKSENHLLLVAEWDTFYGRSFKDLFREALEKSLSGSKSDIREEVNERIHFISYLRGIDGSLPGEKEDSDKKDGKTDKSDPLSDMKKLEQPVGKSQYDYLRRLANATYDLNEQLRAKNRKKEIAAIGVVGSDFYDKYLVLQALRQRFPDVLFFTTDLDARFLHPDNIKWTRNVVVASNFGLSLRRDGDVDLQGGLPPFRDNYQTSMFLTVLRIFREKGSNLNKDERDFLKKLDINKTNETWPGPLVFEIGRHDAICLTKNGDSIYPQNKNMRLGAKIGGIIILGFVVISFASIPVNSFCRRWLFHSDTKYKIRTAVILVIFVLLACAMYYYVNTITGYWYEEPFSIMQGASIWPTELLRLLAFILALLFLYVSHKSMETNRKVIDREFGMGDSDKLLQEDKNTKKQYTRSWAHMMTSLVWEPKEKEERRNLRDVWVEYVSRNSDRYRYARLAVILIVYSVLCWLIITFDAPKRPVRGIITPWVDTIMAPLSFLSLVLLIFYVVDVTRCCRRFIALASEQTTALHRLGENTRDRIENELYLIRLIAARTDAVGKLIFYPFIVWLIMFVSRFDYFDNWKTPPGLAIVISLGAALAWSCALLLRRVAEKTRNESVDRLKDLLRSARSDDKPDSGIVSYAEYARDEIESTRRGAFAPFTQHPILHSLLVPFGGVGGVYLIDFLSKMNF